MLQYIKTVLIKVSFNKELFEKELNKTVILLIPGEVKELKEWCYAEFGKGYRPILHRAFDSIIV